ncbi:CPCC family cysteine-rich protein [Streptomyces nojiriensis]|uniref:CPCC family cysteine-rich protein n=1 Tax=Streptomyces nojiriensis TaxID=66374 RepID=UPI003663C762
MIGIPEGVNSYPCSCCGCRTLEFGPGSQAICPICFWEDDLLQLRWPLLNSAANGVSLIRAQENYIRSGASEERFLHVTRKPTSDEKPDEQWRAIDLSTDRFEQTLEALAPWPTDHTVLYWWSSRFWLLQ